MANRHPRGLPKPNTIAYLAEHVEWLTKRGVFKGQQAARTVFQYWCCHPDAQVPHPDKQAAWECPVHGQHYDPPVIAEATGISERQVRRAIDWLEDGGLVSVDHGGKPKRKAYGPVTIMSTNSSTHWAINYRPPQRRTRSLGTPCPDLSPSPATGHHVPTEDTMSPVNGSSAAWEPPKPKRTVSGVRSSCGNTDGSEPPATLKAPPRGARTGAGQDAPDARTSGCKPGEYPVPATRPQTGEAGLDKAGHSVTVANDSTSTPSASSTPSTSSSGSRQRPGSPRGTRPDTVLREAQACVEAGPIPIDDPLDIRCAASSRDDGQESPGFPSGEARAGARIDLDVARFRLYYDTGLRGYRDSRQDSRMAMA